MLTTPDLVFEEVDNVDDPLLDDRVQLLLHFSHDRHVRKHFWKPETMTTLNLSAQIKTQRNKEFFPKDNKKYLCLRSPCSASLQ
jgi:hypothetical protein